jgi:hypothetical protein
VRAPAILPEGVRTEIGSSDPLQAPETHELVTAFYGISRALPRRRMLELAKALAQRGDVDFADRIEPRAMVPPVPKRKYTRRLRPETQP